MIANLQIYVFATIKKSFELLVLNLILGEPVCTILLNEPKNPPALMVADCQSLFLLLLRNTSYTYIN